MENEIRNKAMDFIEELQNDSEINRTALHFSEDNLVKWLTDFALLTHDVSQNRYYSKEAVIKAIELARSKDFECTADGVSKICYCRNNRDCLYRHYKTEEEIIQSLSPVTETQK